MKNILLRTIRTIAAIALLSVLRLAVADGADVAKLTTALQGSNVDNIVSVINEAKQLSYQSDMIRFMNNLWQGKGLPNGVSVNLIKKDIIRINIADFLVQAHSNGLLDIDTHEFQSYSRGLLVGDDAEAISAALFVLAHIDDPEDAKLIGPFVLSKSQYLFRSSVVALSMMCNDAAEKKLKEMRSNIHNSSRLEIINDTQKKFTRMKNEGGLCSNK